jgi:hypothetical protein
MISVTPLTLDRTHQPTRDALRELISSTGGGRFRETG